MRAELRDQQRMAAELPLESVALPPVSSLADPWSQFRQFQTKQLGHDPRLPANHA